MRLLVFATILATSLAVRAAEPSKAQSGLSKLPVALSDEFQFRKTKLYFLDPAPPPLRRGKFGSSFSKTQAQPDASIGFERSYRMFGAVTGLDQRQRFGHYFDFWWRVKHEANVTVRLEYRQEKLRSFTQAKEISYTGAKGTMHTEFRVIGDEFFDDGKIIAWRCLLISDGRIVAEDRSYMWD
ncbi:MAG: hypothetical protein ACJ8I9_07880 [Chthoniobacterales bacterium]